MVKAETLRLYWLGFSVLVFLSKKKKKKISASPEEGKAESRKTCKTPLRFRGAFAHGISVLPSHLHETLLLSNDLVVLGSLCQATAPLPQEPTKSSWLFPVPVGPSHGFPEILHSWEAFWNKRGGD